MKEKLRDMLILSAKKGETLYYSQLDKKFGFSTNPLLGMSNLYRVLASIGNDEIRDGRPPLNCIVVRKIEQDPGRGFFKWYRDVVNPSIDINSQSEREELFERLKEEVFEFWANESELV